MHSKIYKGVSYPASYATFEDYVKTLEINLRIAEQKKKPVLVSIYKKALKEAKAVL